MEFRNNITNINDLPVGEVYMDAQTRQLYIVIEEGTHTQLLSDFDLKLAEEGFRNFDSKTLTEQEERFIKKLVDPKSGELLDRGQRRKLQLYGDTGERES